MTPPRIYEPSVHSAGNFELKQDNHHYVAHVLRMQVGDTINIFNGEGKEYQGKITQVDKKVITIFLEESVFRHTESPLRIYLGQGIARGVKMDYTIQKAVELGVTKIIPLFTTHCNIKLDPARAKKRQQHWQAIATAAAAQSGRAHVPEVTTPKLFEDVLITPWEVGLVLSPEGDQGLKDIILPLTKRILLLVGPEGGFSAVEIEKAKSRGFISLKLGPRILRTETVALAALTALQCFFGDMA